MLRVYCVTLHRHQQHNLLSEIHLSQVSEKVVHFTGGSRNSKTGEQWRAMLADGVQPDTPLSCCDGRAMEPGPC